VPNYAPAAIPQRYSSIFFRALENLGEVKQQLPAVEIVLLSDLCLAEPVQPVGRLVLYVAPFADEVWFSPVQGTDSVCLECMRYWLRMNAFALMTQEGCQNQQLADENGMVHAARIAAIVISKTVEGEASMRRSVTLGKYATDKIIHHPLLPLRTCTECAGLLRNGEFTMETQRSAITGLIRHVRVSAEPKGGAFVASAAFLSGAVPGRADRDLLRSFGHGSTAQQSYESCLGEALEYYSTLFRGDEPLITGSGLNIAGAVDPRTLLCYSKLQYACRGRANVALPQRHRIPEPWSPTEETRWTAAIDLHDGQTRWVPAACCFTRYTRLLHEAQICQEDTVGAAAGKDVAHAILGAMLELIERDATAIWWYNRTRHNAIHIESFSSDPLTRIFRDLQQCGRSLYLLDITTDLGIPCYVAISADASGGSISFGAAAHFRPEVAALHAATETIQFWLNASAGIAPPDYLKWQTTMPLLQDLPYLMPSDEREAPASLQEQPAEWMLKECLEILTRHSLRAMAVDLSRHDVIVPVYRVFVPGLCPLTNRRGPGRLFDVPVRMGWVHKPLTEQQLNPLCCVF
jgi:thiazole/oxazole-forming peptide maturase SagD family component